MALAALGACGDGSSAPKTYALIQQEGDFTYEWISVLAITAKVKNSGTGTGREIHCVMGLKSEDGTVIDSGDFLYPDLAPGESAESSALFLDFTDEYSAQNIYHSFHCRWRDDQGDKSN